MRRLGFVSAVVALLAFGCGDSAEPPLSATETVESWLDALGGGDDPTPYVLEQQLPILSAIGRPVDGPDIVRSGLSAESVATYWASLADEMSEVAGASPSELTVGESIELVVDGTNYAYVEIAGDGGASVLVVQVDRGPRIDLLATTGPELIRPLTRLLDALAPGDYDGRAIAESLRAGLADPNLSLPTEFVGEVQELIFQIDR